ncbi:MAG: hypothetical protein V7K40_27365 [Nostoc sp.]
MIAIAPKQSSVILAFAIASFRWRCIRNDILTNSLSLRSRQGKAQQS